MKIRTAFVQALVVTAATGFGVRLPATVAAAIGAREVFRVDVAASLRRV
jgi:hypothetical protein